MLPMPEGFYMVWISLFELGLGDAIIYFVLVGILIIHIYIYTNNVPSRLSPGGHIIYMHYRYIDKIYRWIDIEIYRYLMKTAWRSYVAAKYSNFNKIDFKFCFSVHHIFLKKVLYICIYTYIYYIYIYIYIYICICMYYIVYKFSDDGCNMRI